MNGRRILLVLTISLFLGGTGAWANIEQFKIYKKVFPDAKVQCNVCHIDEKPKKDDGQHDLNAYGKKVKETAGTDAVPTEETYKALGGHEDFKE